MGRPRKNEVDRHVRHIMIRVTSREKEDIVRMAGEARLSLSSFLREIITKRKPVFDTRVKAEYVKELNAIGHNLNQLVRGFHLKEIPKPQELYEIRQQLEKLNNLISKQSDH